MKNLIVIFSIFLNSLLYGQPGNIVGNWKLISVKNNQTNQIDTTFRDQKILTISFSSDTLFKGRLTVNSFSGIYKINKDQIKIGTEFITFICCDTETALEFPDDLFQAETFKINGDSLVLTGPRKVLYLLRLE